MYNCLIQILRSKGSGFISLGLKRSGSIGLGFEGSGFIGLGCISLGFGFRVCRLGFGGIGFGFWVQGS